MIRFMSIAAISTLALTLSCAGTQSIREQKATGNERIQTSIDVLNSLVSIPEQTIPEAVLRDAKGVAIIPGVLKGAFIIGGRYGNGVMVAKQRNGVWSYPGFIELRGGSIGWQWGVESVDLVLVFRTQRSVDAAAGGQFTLGAGASVSAGPVGRSASAMTDEQLSAEIYSYARSRGLFLGVSLQGASIGIDNTLNGAFYGMQNVSSYEIYSGAIKSSSAPDAAERLRKVVASVTGGQ